MSRLKLTNLAILAIEQDVQIVIDECIKEFAFQQTPRTKF